MAEVEEMEEVEKSGGGKKKLILVIIAALLLVGAAVGGTFMFIGGGDTEAEANTEEAEAVVERGSPSYVDLKPAFTVNLDPEDSVGFLQISIQVLTYDDDVAAQIEKHKPLIRNNLMTLFGQQKSVDLRTPEGKEALQKLALLLIQDVIDKRGGGGEIDNVFFTSFVMQ